MNILHDISPKEINAESFTAVIEIPAGSKVQIQITGTSTAMVAYVDDIAITYGNDADGISEVEVATSSGDGSRYNLSGQKVDGHYKGIVISNGKKTIEK